MAVFSLQLEEIRYYSLNIEAESEEEAEEFWKAYDEYDGEDISLPEFVEDALPEVWNQEIKPVDNYSYKIISGENGVSAEDVKALINWHREKMKREGRYSNDKD